jgi:hypothetical protein
MTMGIYDELARIEDEGEKARDTAAPRHPSPPQKEPKSVESPRHDVRHDVTPDLVTLPLGQINLRNWRIGLENTETRNSALRLTSAERDRVEDLVRELWRRHKVRTSMNEVARLGLRVIERDFRRSDQGSLVYRLKRS